MVIFLVIITKGKKTNNNKALALQQISFMQFSSGSMGCHGLLLCSSTYPPPPNLKLGNAVDENAAPRDTYSNSREHVILKSELSNTGTKCKHKPTKNEELAVVLARA